MIIDDWSEVETNNFMPFTSETKNFSSVFIKQLSKLKFLGLNLLLGVGAIAFFNTSANAAQSIILVHNETQISTSMTELRAFVNKGEMTQDLQQLFQNTSQNSESVRQLLATRIPVSRTLVERNFSNSTDRFLLIQLDKLLGTVLRQENLEPLRSALVNAYGDDDRLSVLEVIQEYPESKIRVDLRSLEKVYNDVKDLITRIQPLLAVSEELLPELVCDCENSATGSKTNSSVAELPQLLVSANRSGVGLLAPTSSCSNAMAGQSANAASSVTTAALVVESEKPSRATRLKASVVQSDTPPLATKQLVLTFGPLMGSIFVRELESFAQTGQLSSSLGFYLKQAKVKPEDFRDILVQEVNVSAKLLDRTLNTLLGEYLLFQIGQVIHTRSQRANIQALRSALVLSATGDSRISLLEFLQNYPNQQIYVNGIRLARVSRFAKRGLAGIEDRLVEVQASVADSVCDCKSE